MSSQIGMVILIAILVLTLLGVFDAPAMGVSQQMFSGLGSQGSTILGLVLLGIVKACWMGGLLIIILYILRFGRIPNIFGEDI